jgi:hypothetical protein
LYLFRRHFHSLPLEQPFIVPPMVFFVINLLWMTVFCYGLVRYMQVHTIVIMIFMGLGESGEV